MNLFEMPGFLGLTSRGVLAIHADWPTYPLEHGWDVALRTFGLFPRGCTLRRIDSIDRCWLFVVMQATNTANPFDEKHLHAAVWEADMKDLRWRGLIAGVEEITLADWISQQEKAVGAPLQHRRMTHLAMFGIAFPSQLMTKIAAPPFIAAYSRILRGELRTTFKYVRNEYMHNLQPTDETQCYALLARLSDTLDWLDGVQLTLTREQS